MKNERGLTLVELLGVLVIVGAITTLIISILLNGINASNRNATKQSLQQEANYITEVIRKEYLKTLENDILINIDVNEKLLKVDGKIISEGYNYHLATQNELSRKTQSPFKLTIDKNGQSYTIDTTFSKLR